MTSFCCCCLFTYISWTRIKANPIPPNLLISFPIFFPELLTILVPWTEVESDTLYIGIHNSLLVRSL